MDYKKYIAEKIKVEGVNAEEIEASIAVPPDTTLGDYALPCFKFAKALRKSPVVIAQELASAIVTDSVIANVTAVNGYLNFAINRTGLVKETLGNIAKAGKEYGSADIGSGKTVCIDYSSVNIAKPFHIGHLSTTVLGSSLYKIYSYLGYKVVGKDHLGDYGTRFVKLICAY